MFVREEYPDRPSDRWAQTSQISLEGLCTLLHTGRLNLPVDLRSVT